MKSFYYLGMLLIALSLGLMSCSEETINEPYDKYGDREAKVRRAYTIELVNKMDMDNSMKAQIIEELNKDQVAIRNQMIMELQKEGINPDDILLAPLDRIVSEAGSHKVDQLKAQQAQCNRAYNSYVPQLRYSFSSLTTADLATLRTLNFEISGSYDFAALDQYKYIAGLTDSQARSIVEIDFGPNQSTFYFQSSDGAIIVDAIQGLCY